MFASAIPIETIVHASQTLRGILEEMDFIWIPWLTCQALRGNGCNPAIGKQFQDAPIRVACLASIAHRFSPDDRRDPIIIYARTISAFSNRFQHLGCSTEIRRRRVFCLTRTSAA